MHKIDILLNSSNRKALEKHKYLGKLENLNGKCMFQGVAH
jgi:hypothetical protein